MKKFKVYEIGEGSDTSKYDVVVEKQETNDTQVSLRYSAFNGGWSSTIIGTEYARAECDGNGVTVFIDDDSSGFRLDYCQFEALRLVLHAMSEASFGFAKKLTKYDITKY